MLMSVESKCMLMSVEIDQFYKVNIIGYMTFSCQAGIDNYYFN